MYHPKQKSKNFTKEPAVICEACGTTFTRKDNLKRHLEYCKKQKQEVNDVKPTGEDKMQIGPIVDPQHGQDEVDNKELFGSRDVMTQTETQFINTNAIRAIWNRLRREAELMIFLEKYSEMFL